jgi:hypothetical protein
MLFQMPGDDVTCGGVKTHTHTHGVYKKYKILFSKFLNGGKNICRPRCVHFFVRENFLNVYLFCVCVVPISWWR